MALVLSHGGGTIFSSPSPSNEIMVGTKEGIVFIKREAEDSAWKVVHRALSTPATSLGVNAESFLTAPLPAVVYTVYLGCRGI